MLILSPDRNSVANEMSNIIMDTRLAMRITLAQMRGFSVHRVFFPSKMHNAVGPIGLILDIQMAYLHSDRWAI